MYRPTPPQHGSRYEPRAREAWEHVSFAEQVRAGPLTRGVRSPRQRHYRQWQKEGRGVDFEAYLMSRTYFGADAEKSAAGMARAPKPKGKGAKAAVPPSVRGGLRERKDRRGTRSATAAACDVYGTTATNKYLPKASQRRRTGKSTSRSGAADRAASPVSPPPDTPYARLRGWTGVDGPRSPDSVETTSLTDASEEADPSPPRVFRATAEGLLQELGSTETPVMPTVVVDTSCRAVAPAPSRGVYFNLPPGPPPRPTRQNAAPRVRPPLKDGTGTSGSMPSGLATLIAGQPAAAAGVGAHDGAPPSGDALKYQVLYGQTRGRLCRAAPEPLAYPDASKLRAGMHAQATHRPRCDGGAGRTAAVNSPHASVGEAGDRRPVPWGDGGLLRVLTMCLDMKDEAQVDLLDELLANCTFPSDRTALHTLYAASVVACELYGEVYPQLSGVHLLVLMLYCRRPVPHVECSVIRAEIAAAFTAPTPELCMKWARCIALIIVVTMWPLRPAASGGLCVPSESYRESLEWVGAVEGDALCWRAPPVFMAKQHPAAKNSSATPRLGFFLSEVDFGLAAARLMNVENAVLLPPLFCFAVDSVSIEGIHCDIHLAPLSPNPLQPLRDKYWSDGWDAANSLRSACSETSPIHRVIREQYFIASTPSVAAAAGCGIAATEKKLRDALEADFTARALAIERSQTKPDHLRHLFYGF